MKIKAKVAYTLYEVYIIDFVIQHNCTYAVYIDNNGKVNVCDIAHVKILDTEYIPPKN
jgi:hypothetical protein